MPKKKVLFFLPSGVGGAERVTITIAKMLDREKFDVKFVIVGRSKGDISELIPETYPIELLYVYNIWCFATLKIINLLKRERPDTVFCSLRYLNPRVILAALIVGRIKTIIRNDNTLQTLSMLQRLFIKASYRWADVIIAQQEEMRNEILSFTNTPGSKIIALQNPLDIEMIDGKVEKSQSPYRDDGIHYVCVGRIGKHKGQDVLISAFNIVHNKDAKTHLYLVGQYSQNDTYYKDLCQEINLYHLNDFVHFVGYTDNPYVWIKYADCCVLSSRNEGLPNVLLEALYLKTPSVATKCIPVIERIIKDGETGMLVPSEDYQSMANAMIDALTHRFMWSDTFSSTNATFIHLFES